MGKKFAVALIFGVFTNVLGGDPKFSVSNIPAELKEGMYAVIQERETQFHIESRSSCTYMVHKVITILNVKAKNNASVVIGYDKNIRVEGIKATVYDAGGNQIKKLKQSDIIDQSAVSGFSLYDDNRIKHFDLSQSTYPYTIEYEYVLHFKYLYSIPGFYLYNDDEISTLKASYSLTYPKDLKPRYRLFKIEQPKVVDYTQNKESLVWEFTNIKPTKFEKFSPESDKVIPNIKAAPTAFEYEGYVGSMQSWEEYGKWIALLNNGRDALPEATKQTLKNITKDLKSTTEKTRAVYEYLQSKTRYVSIQLGIGGLQTFDASLVDQTGYGDCKALSNYTVAMLKEVGVKAYYTTIMAGENEPDVIVDFPSHQGNHVIVSVPNGADTLWLECTNQTIPFGYIGTFTDDRKGLMITEKGGKLVHTIRYSAEQNFKSRSADVFVEKTGDATAKVKTIYSGLQYENDNLNFYLNNEYDDQRKWIQDNTIIPSFDIVKFHMTEKKEKIPRAIVNLDLSLKRFATVSGKRLFLTPNLMNRSTYVPEKLESRKTNVVLRTAYTDFDTIRYHLPEGIYPEFMPQAVKLKSRFGEYEAGFTLDQNNLIYIRRIRMNKGEFPPESYNELIEFYRNLSKADNTKMVFLSKT